MASLDTKFLFVTGGGAASLGKGLISASIGLLLKSRGLRVAIQRVDPYLNVDKRTVDPALHGEIYLTEDGGEVSFHVGDYERFLNEPQSSEHSITVGQIYHSVLLKERRGGYGGHLVRIRPDVVDEIKARLTRPALAKKPDVLITEIGGSINDIDTLPFLEASRQLSIELEADDVLFIHIVLVPYVRVSKRYETSGACQSIRDLRSWGIEPKVVIARSESPLPSASRQEISLVSSVPIDAIFEAVDVESIYEIPQNLHRQGLDRTIAKVVNLKTKEPDFTEWNLFLQRMKTPFRVCEVAVCGSTTMHRNSHRSLVEALNHAAVANNIRLRLYWLDTSTVTNPEQIATMLQSVAGVILVGTAVGPSMDGEINVSEYARTQGKPFVGIDLGCHAALIEFARNVGGLRHADTQELNENSRVPLIQAVSNPRRPAEALSGGAMRLGSCAVSLVDNTLASQIYRKREVTERFRHCFALNPKYVKRLAKAGMVASGISSRRRCHDFFELKAHPFFVGVQYHPEYRSTPLAPHPIFYQFLKKVIKLAETVSGK